MLWCKRKEINSIFYRLLLAESRNAHAAVAVVASAVVTGKGGVGVKLTRGGTDRGDGQGLTPYCSPSKLFFYLSILFSWVLLSASPGSIVNAQLTTIQCRNCHGVVKDLHHGMPDAVAGRCTACHAGVVVSGDCKGCHTKAGLPSPLLSSMHKLQMALNGQCNFCHLGTENVDIKNCRSCHTGEIRVFHHALAKAGKPCLDCHKTIVAQPPCAGCHKPWKNSTNPHHATIWATNNQCEHCHTIGVANGIQVLQIGACPDCHRAAGQPLLSDRHHGTQPAVMGQCSTCHVGVELTGGDCAGCHLAPGGFKPTHHTSTWAQSGDCTHCHKGISINMSACSSCHAGPIRDIHHGAPLQQHNGDCGFCHTGVSTPASCSNCHNAVPHHTSVPALTGDCAHCHVPPASASDVPKQAACRQCHVGKQHINGPKVSNIIQNYGACFYCHAPTPFHGKPGSASGTTTGGDSTKSSGSEGGSGSGSGSGVCSGRMGNWPTGRGTFNLFQSSLGGSGKDNKGPCDNKDNEGKYDRPTISYNMKTISHAGSSYQVPSFDGNPLPVDSRIPPVLRVKAPRAGNIVSGIVSIRAEAGDNSSITRVDYRIDSGAWIQMTGPNGSANGDWTANWNSVSSLGSRLITVQATDNENNITSVVVGVTVMRENNPPVAVNDAYTVAGNTTLTVSGQGVLVNDTDADGNPLKAILVSGVANGTLSLAAGGSFTYTPRANFSGTDKFVYKVNDGKIDSNTATVNITVSAVVVARPVVTTLNPSSVTQGTSLTINGTGFGSQRALSKVKIAGKAVPVLRIKTWSDTQITLDVPAYKPAWFAGKPSKAVKLIVSVKPDASTPVAASAPVTLTVLK